jgi:hypothetical protein
VGLPFFYVYNLLAVHCKSGQNRGGRALSAIYGCGPAGTLSPLGFSERGAIHFGPDAFGFLA